MEPWGLHTPPGGGGGRVPRHEDCLSRTFHNCLSVCCGKVCGIWTQCCSICALAQEAREVRLLATPKSQRLDWITHQPFEEYYRDIVELRNTWLNRATRNWGWAMKMRLHIYALSQLSRLIIATFLLLTIIIVITEKFNPRANFTWADSIVMLLTFAQSFLVIFFIHGIFHKSDLSFDAVVKFFATGFVISMPTAFVFEGVLISVMFISFYSIYGICQYLLEDTFVAFYANYYFIFWIVGECINAYVVAAMTEELCKYYAFRSVEHPDLIFLTGLDRRDPDPKSVYGGYRNYTYSSHNIVRAPSGDDTSTIGDSTYMSRSLAEVSHYEEKSEARTLRQRAAAVTTAMISCAVGLACAENFIYVFFFGTIGDAANSRGSGSNSNASQELGMLVLRSIFPVHALCAAMQSIGVIRKFLEPLPSDGSHHTGVGRIILPAVVLHGTFDAILMLIDVYIEFMWSQYFAANGDDAEVPEEFVPYDPVLLNAVAWGAIVFTMLSGFIWYSYQNRNQKAKLKFIEEQEASVAKTGGDGEKQGLTGQVEDGSVFKPMIKRLV